MSRDYKGNDRKGGSRGSSGSLFAGILIGLVLGLAVALGVAWYINKMPTPFQPKAPAAKPEPPKAAASDPVKAADKATARPAEEAKPRFDFYKILPGVEEPATDQQLRETKAAARESFYLQAGAFQNAPDADNLKARLALIGVQASIQTTTLPDRGVWHRVRLGPYGNVEELNRTRDTLKKNGIDTTLIKVRDADK
ncbi:MAG: SPOR domain-containing protein [Burkholderiales bacterium]|nr:SPOR domain-containing protein [Burkholderiales bacterium]